MTGSFLPAPLAPLKASDLARFLGAPLQGYDCPITGLCTLSKPQVGCLGFIKAGKEGAAPSLPSGSVWLVSALPPPQPGVAVIVADNPRHAFSLAVARFFVEPPEPGIHPSAVVHASVVVGTGVSIGPGSVIDARCQIGDHTVIRSNVVLCRGVRIGAHCLIKSNSVIGEEGFGMEQGPDGNNVRVPHLGSVVIGDHVEIGALCTVCSGTVEPTVIEDHVKMDDHIHVAHNCRVGRNSLLTACAELSGSVQIGSNVWVGPNASLMNGIMVGNDAFIGLGAVVTKDCDAGWIYAGNPARRLRPRKERL